MKSIKRKSKLVIPLLLIGTLFLVASTVSDMSLAYRPSAPMPEDDSNNDVMQRPSATFPERVNENLEIISNNLGAN
jgi:hypothetical protein